MSETKILVNYDEFVKKVDDSADLQSVKSILGTEFPDDTCQLLAIKAILGMIPEPTETPSDDEPSNSTENEGTEPSETEGGTEGEPSEGTE